MLPLLVEIKPDLASEVRMQQPCPRILRSRIGENIHTDLFHVISLYFTLHTNVYLVVS